MPLDIYADLDDNERVIYQQHYAEETAIMSGFAERFIRQGEEKGRQEGRQEEGALILTQLLTLKFGPQSAAVRQRVQRADPDTLLHWSARVLTATSLDEVFADGESP